MKRLFVTTFALCMGAFLLASSLATAQPITDAQGDVVIGGVAPDPSAILDLQSTTKGFLMPRMTDAQRDAIVSPAEGLMVYNTDVGAQQINTGTAGSPVWETVITDSTLASYLGNIMWLLGGNDTTTAFDGVSGNFLGTNEVTDLVLATDSTIALTIDGGTQEVTVANDFTVNGNSQLDGDLNVDGNSTLNGDVDLGDGSGDAITIDATGGSLSALGLTNDAAPTTFMTIDGADQVFETDISTLVNTGNGPALINNAGTLEVTPGNAVYGEGDELTVPLWVNGTPTSELSNSIITQDAFPGGTEITIGGNAVVTGTSDLQGAVSNSTGNLLLDDDVDVTGDLDAQSTIFNTLGNLILDDDVDVTGDLDAQSTIFNTTGNLILDDDVDVTGILDAQTTIVNTTGDVTVDDNLIVTGTSDLQDAIFNSTGNNGGDVFINDNATVQSVLNVNGNTFLNAQLDVDGASFFHNTIDQDGGGQITLSGNVDANNGVDVAGSDLTVDAAVRIEALGDNHDFGTPGTNAQVMEVLGVPEFPGPPLFFELITDDLLVNGTLALPSLTPGGVVYVGPGGELLTQNPPFAYDDVTMTLTTENLTVNTDADMLGTVFNSGGNLILDDDVDVTGILDAQTTIVNTTGDVTIDDNLIVTGTSDLQDAIFNSTGNNGGDVFINDNATVQSVLNVNGNTFLNAQLDVDGASFFHNTIDQDGGGQITLSGNVDANNGVDVAGADLTVDMAVSIQAPGDGHSMGTAATDAQVLEILGDPFNVGQYELFVDGDVQITGFLSLPGLDPNSVVYVDALGNLATQNPPFAYDDVTMTMTTENLTVNTDADMLGTVFNSGGNLILDDDVDVTGSLQVDVDLTVDGNSTLGDDPSADATTINGETVMNETAGGAGLIVNEGAVGPGIEVNEGGGGAGISVIENASGSSLRLEENNPGHGINIVENDVGNGILIDENGDGDGINVTNNGAGNAITATGRIDLAGASSPLSADGDDGALGDILLSQGAGATPDWQDPNGLFWQLEGNSGTTSLGSGGTNFVGTTDGVELTLATAGTAALTIDETDQQVDVLNNFAVAGNSTLGDDPLLDVTTVNGELIVNEDDPGAGIDVTEASAGPAIRIAEGGAGSGIAIIEGGVGDGITVANNGPGNAISATGRIDLVGANSPLSADGDDGALGDILLSQGAGATPDWQDPNGLFWQLEGNSGTTSLGSGGTNFVGTTDGVELTLATAGTAALTIDETDQQVDVLNNFVVAGNSTLGDDAAVDLHVINGGTTINETDPAPGTHGLTVNVPDVGRGISVTESGDGEGLYISESDNGAGLWVNEAGTGSGIRVDEAGTFHGIVVNSDVAAGGPGQDVRIAGGVIDAVGTETSADDVWELAVEGDGIVTGTLAVGALNAGLNPDEIVFGGPLGELAQNANFVWTDADEHLQITNTTGMPAVTISEDGTSEALVIDDNASDGAAASITEGGLGAGLIITEADGGHGLDITESGATGSGINVTESGNAHGINITEADGGNGINVIESGVAHGISINEADGGNGLNITEAGAGNGINVTADATGTGIRVNGTADAAVTDVIATGTFDVEVVGDIGASGIIKSGAGVWLDGVSATHAVGADQPLDVMTTNASDLTISTNSTVAVTVDGTTQNVDITNDLGVGNDLTVTNDASVGNNLTVTNDASIGNDASVGNDLTVTNDASVGNNLTVTNDASIGNDASVGNDLTVTNDASVGNNLTVTNDASIGNDASVGNDLTVTNDASVGNNLTVTNDASIGNDASVGNDLTVTNDASVGNNLTVTNDASIGNDASVGNDLTVTNDASVGNDLAVTNNASVDGNLTAGDDPAVDLHTINGGVTITETSVAANSHALAISESGEGRGLTITEADAGAGLFVSEDGDGPGVRITEAGAGPGLRVDADATGQGVRINGIIDATGAEPIGDNVWELAVNGDANIAGTLTVGTLDFGLTQGSVLFADATGGITENNTDFNWDNATSTLALNNPGAGDALTITEAGGGVGLVISESGANASMTLDDNGSGGSGIVITEGGTGSAISITEIGGGHGIVIDEAGGGDALLVNTGTVTVTPLAGAADQAVYVDNTGELQSGTGTAPQVAMGIFRGRVAIGGALTTTVVGLTSITATSTIMITYEDQTASGIVSGIVSTITPGTGFTVTWSADSSRSRRIPALHRYAIRGESFRHNKEVRPTRKGRARFHRQRTTVLSNTIGIDTLHHNGEIVFGSDSTNRKALHLSSEAPACNNR